MRAKEPTSTPCEIDDHYLIWLLGLSVISLWRSLSPRVRNGLAEEAAALDERASLVASRVR